MAQWSIASSPSANGSGPRRASFICTDIGSRVIVAMQITDDVRSDSSWLNGPPCALAELVFDEDDQVACYMSEAAMLADC
jgi:hypothetical protein